MATENRGAVMLILASIITIFLSGLFFAGLYFMMGTVQSGLEGVNCDLPGTSYGTCQAWFDDTIYKVLNLKSILITWSFIFIFALSLGLLVVGYKAGTNPIYIGVLFLVILGLTYLGIMVSNVYRGLINSPLIYDIMQPFTVYNKIMLNFPWFIGFIGLLSITLSIVNYQRVKVNTPTSDLDY